MYVYRISHGRARRKGCRRKWLADNRPSPSSSTTDRSSSLSSSFIIIASIHRHPFRYPVISSNHPLPCSPHRTVYLLSKSCIRPRPPGPTPHPNCYSLTSSEPAFKPLRLPISAIVPSSANSSFSLSYSMPSLQPTPPLLPRVHPSPRHPAVKVGTPATDEQAVEVPR